GEDIEPLYISLDATERQKAGERFDDSGFSAAIGAEETEDFAFLDAEADIVDRSKVAEAAHEMLRRDGNFPVRLRSRGHGFNSPLSGSRRQPCLQEHGQRDH